MGLSRKNLILASRLNQRAIEFFNSAESLRVNFSAAVHVIDYCTALSFELRLKSILAVRDRKLWGHDICKLFDECNISFNHDKHNELIKYYDTILCSIARYSTTREGDREKLDAALSRMYKKKPNYFNIPDENCVYEINPGSGIVDDTYKEIWETLDNIFKTEYVAAQKNLTS